MKNKQKNQPPKTEAVTFYEGGIWVPFEEWMTTFDQKCNGLVHSIRFENGWIWDVVNGWRPTKKGGKDDSNGKS